MTFFLNAVNSILFLAILMLTSCSNENCEVRSSNGITYYYNKAPLHDNIKLYLKKKVVINNDEIPIKLITPTVVDFDNNDNVFILDTHNSSITKFSSFGEFICTFGNKGQGPGEFLNTRSMTIVDNTVYIADIIQKRIVVFDNNGKFIKNISLNNWAPKNISTLSSNLIIGVEDNNIPEDNNKITFNSYVNLYDSNFIKVSTIEQRKETSAIYNSFNPLNLQIMFTHNNSSIYVAATNTDGYIINSYSRTGKLENKIIRNYKRVPVSKDFLGKINERYSFTKDGEKINAKLNIEYMNSIQLLRCDKYDRLWSLPAKNQKDSLTKFDIFVDNVYYGICEFPISLKGSIPYFKNDKIVILNQEIPEVTIYDYE